MKTMKYIFLICTLLTLTTAFAQERFETLTDTIATGINGYGLRATNIKSNNRVTYTDALGTVRTSTIDVASLGDQLNDGFITGGIVTYSGTGLTFDVTAAVYYINGTRYTSNAGSITLTAADATNDRIDVIALDNTGTIVKITGTASANPIEPQVDPNTQIKLTSISVSAGSTTPANITSTIVYDENVEWAATTSGTIAVNFNGTTNNFHGSKNTTVTSWANGSQIIYINSGTITVSGSNTLKAFFRLSNALTSGQNIFAQLYNGGNSVSGTVNLSSYGLNRGSVGAYQNVSIPFNAFKLKSNTFDRVIFGFSGSNGNVVNLDYVQVQGGITTNTSSNANKLDTSAVYINNIVLQGSGILHTSPATYNYSNHTATLTQTLATQNAYSIFATGATSAKPTFIQGLTDNYIASISASKVFGTAGGAAYFNSSGVLSTNPNYTYNDATNQLNVSGNAVNYNTPLNVTNTSTIQSGKDISMFNGNFSHPDTVNNFFEASNLGIMQHDNTLRNRVFLNFYNAAGKDAVDIGAQFNNHSSTYPSADLVIGVADSSSTEHIEAFRIKSSGVINFKKYAGGTGIRALGIDSLGNITVGAAITSGGTGSSVNSIVLNTGNVIHNSPVTLTKDASNNWTGTMTLKTQAANTVLGTDTAGAWRSMPAVIYDYTGATNNTYPKYDSVHKYFVPSIISTSGLQRYDSLLVFSGSSLPQNATYGYSITDHRIHVKDSGNHYEYRFAVQDSTYAPGLYYLSFTGTGLSNTGNVWLGNNSPTGSFNSYGVSNVKLAAGNDGYIEFQYVAIDGRDAFLAFNTSNVSEKYTGYEAGVYISSGDNTVQAVDNGVVKYAGGTAANSVPVIGNYYRVNVAGTAGTLQTSSDHNTWTTLFTYTFTRQPGVNLYVNINPDYGKKLYYPRGYNVQ